MSARAKETITRYFAECDVCINGSRPTDIQIRDPRFYTRALAQGSMGFGESYMDGWWEAADLDGMITRLLGPRLDQRVRSWRDITSYLLARIVNLQGRARAFQVGERHYDIGNTLYERMLDRRMIYSCAYWVNASSLDEAQENKLDLVFRKLDLKPGQQVLDIGCGWGGSLKYAVEKYGVGGVGVTVSKEQAEAARANCKGLPIEIRLIDYRELNGKFDHIYSIGMFEHVGPKNYRTYMQVVRRCLNDGGRFLLHTIGSGRLKSNVDIDPWLGKYIFPNAVVPRQKHVLDAIHGVFRLDGWQRIGPHYDTTLMAWRANFEKAWADLSRHFDARFHRMWRYYLSSVAAGFRSGNADVWQALLSKA